jgi:hypothetical protein
MDKPLAGLKVVELARILAGPWAGQLLGRPRRRVIKVERPGTGDDTRAWGPPFRRRRQCGLLPWLQPRQDFGGVRILASKRVRNRSTRWPATPTY